MNQTDEYLLQTFEQANEGFSETVADVWAEVAQRPEEDVADKDLVFMDRLLEVTGFPKESLVEYLAGELGMEPAELSEVNPTCLLYTSPSPRDLSTSRMPSSA